MNLHQTARHGTLYFWSCSSVVLGRGWQTRYVWADSRKSFVCGFKILQFQLQGDTFWKASSSLMLKVWLLYIGLNHIYICGSADGRHVPTPCQLLVHVKTARPWHDTTWKAPNNMLNTAWPAWWIVLSSIWRKGAAMIRWFPVPSKHPLQAGKRLRIQSVKARSPGTWDIQARLAI